ncbi:MAG: FitA-like ribbon-helix-helix domain-containing protein [Microvirga sp.]
MIDGIAVTPHPPAMATLTVRNLPDEVRDQLRVRAARNGRSMEAEARAVLAAGVNGENRSQEQKDVRARVRRLQEIMKPYRSKDRSVVDEFLAERRKLWGEE